jgi:transcriptional regulator with XRE-family HTH domain
MRPINTTPVHNRLDAILGHMPDYWFNPTRRLAQEAGVSMTAIQRLIAGKSSPSYSLVWSIAKVLEKHLGKPINPMEIVSIDGAYPTPSVHDLCGCKGCTPPRVYQGRESLPTTKPSPDNGVEARAMAKEAA